MQNFDGFDLNPILSTSLKYMKYEKPTEIQAKAIPLALAGHDIMGSAQTGTGKTAAFAIPAIERLLNTDEGSVLILTPTRELGRQIIDIMRQLIGPRGGIKSAFIIGGEPMGKQFKQLDKNPRLIVGTPGRINDHLERGSLNLSDTTYLVLDETDRMLDMGFSVQLERIIKHLPEERQTLMFSATLPKNIIKMSQQYLTNPERVAVGSTITPAKNIKQDIIHVKEDKKHQVLSDELTARSGTVIIFVKTKYATEKMAKKLNNEGFTAEAIHGDMKQGKRERTIRELRAEKFRILVATDVVARGLDVPHIKHVINYDLPQVPEDYIHRIGRTARAGAEGEALCLISPRDSRNWHAIQQLLDPEYKPKRSKNDNGKPSKKKKPFKGKGSGKGPMKPRTVKNSEKTEQQRSDEWFNDNDPMDIYIDHSEGKKKKSKPKSKSQRHNGERKDRDYSKSDKPHSKRKKPENRSSKKRWDDKPRGNRSRDDKARGDKPRSDRPRSDKPRNDRPKSDRPRSDRPEGDHMKGKRSKGKKPFTDNGKPKSKGKRFSNNKNGPNKGKPKRSGGDFKIKRKAA